MLDMTCEGGTALLKTHLAPLCGKDGQFQSQVSLGKRDRASSQCRSDKLTQALPTVWTPPDTRLVTLPCP